MNLKLSNETEFIRLCSPNYNGLFEMSLAKNEGINYVNVDYTYKPQSPYIRLQPDFKGLYGSDRFRDVRGLICGGNFSVGYIQDAWINYEIQNKNYNQIFNREILNLDRNYQIEREQLNY